MLEHGAAPKTQFLHIAEIRQLALFPETCPIIKELKKLTLDSMTPLEALNKLYELQRKWEWLKAGLPRHYIEL